MLIIMMMKMRYFLPEIIKKFLGPIQPINRLNFLKAFQML